MQRSACRALAVLVLLFAVVAIVFGASMHPASAAPGPETRVGASGESIQPFVGPPQTVSAGQSRGATGFVPTFVVATGVAAKTAAEACSFSGTTLVLMADGSKKPIEQIKPGDKVLATDPETGKQVAKKVTGTIKHWDRMSDLVLADGSVLRTTEDHPFWPVDDQRFERSDQLGAGERVLSADGRTVKVEGLEWVTGRDGWAYNLEVEGIHTYHVGPDEILVHNTCPVVPWATGSLPEAEEAALGRTLSHIDAGTKPTGPLARRWGATFKNWGGDLPGAKGPSSPYREYRVEPPEGSGNVFRVVQNNETGATYYSWTHYGDAGDPAFVRIR